MNVIKPTTLRKSSRQDYLKLREMRSDILKQSVVIVTNCIVYVDTVRREIGRFNFVLAKSESLQNKKKNLFIRTKQSYDVIQQLPKDNDRSQN